MEAIILSSTLLIYIILMFRKDIYEACRSCILLKYKNIKRTIKKSLLVRERLKVLYELKTDKATYIAYNTQTIQGYDCVNIEIEKQVYGRNRLILEKEIFDDSFGAMGGDSFYSLMRSSRSHLIDYIKNSGEFILNETTY